MSSISRLLIAVERFRVAKVELEQAIEEKRLALQALREEGWVRVEVSGVMVLVPWEIYDKIIEMKPLGNSRIWQFLSSLEFGVSYFIED